MKALTFLKIICEKVLMVLIFTITLNYIVVGLMGSAYNDLSDWLTLLFSIFFYFLSIYFINRHNLIGCIIITYMAASDLILSHQVISTLVSFSLFQSGPQLVLTNILNIMIIGFTVIAACLIVLKHFQPQLFKQEAKNTLANNFFKRHQLNLVLASIILILLAVYWLAWWIISNH